MPLSVWLITQAQAVVLLEHTVASACSSASAFERFARHQQQRLVPVLALGDGLLEEPVLHRRQRHRAAGRALVDQLLLAATRASGQGRGWSGAGTGLRG